MYVKQGIGRDAGQVVDMPFEQAQALLANGTATKPTEEEVLAAQEAQVARGPDIHPDQLLVGWRTEPAESGGFDLYDPGGVKVNGEPFHNQIAARDGAIAAARRSRGLPDLFGEDSTTSQGAGGGEGSPDYKAMTVEDLRVEANKRKIDDATARKKADWIGLLEHDDKVQKAIAERDFDALTIPDLKKIAEEQNIDLGSASSKPEIVAAVSEKYKAPEPAAA